ncbi:phosphoglycerate mutase-like protein [Mycena crocata]|nr:phosphoglycerate mutase-like protein [Mycena crocata]
MSGTQFTAIHSSPLQRAYMTAEAIQRQQPGSPAIVTSPLFREQHFGVAEGKSSMGKRDPDIPLVSQFSAGIYPSLLGRTEKFPEGESMDEVQLRASQAWADLLLPYLQQATKENCVHVLIVSHGVFIKEALRAVAKYDRTCDMAACDYQWLRNTAWARVVVGVKEADEGEGPFTSQGILPALRVQLTHFNQCEHLATVKRQKGGIGREAYDPRQKDIRGFFGGRSAGRKSNGQDRPTISISLD